MAPAAMASHHVGPPGETGLGPSDVTNEPSTGADSSGDAVNGFGGCTTSDPSKPATSCGGPGTPLDNASSSTGPPLVLDGDVSQGSYPYFLDINSILRETSDQSGADTGEYIYPGINFFAAWFGWWTDKGRGEALRDGDANPAGPIPGVADDSPDGSINDGHDDHQKNGGTHHTGPWDEFVWRGQNPWASQHGYRSHPDDVMRVFVHPGTHETGAAGGTGDGSTIAGGLFLVTDEDDPQKPDFKMDDRTAQNAGNPAVVSHNNQGYGWINGDGFYSFQYDQSFLISTEVTYSVNPEPVGQGRFDPDSGVREDTDMYTAIHSAIETAYRTSVWDPGNKQSSPGDAVHEEGPKQLLKETYTDEGQSTINTGSELVNQLTGPLDAAQGAADDAIFAPRPHEPDLPGQTYNGQASYGDDTYGGIGETYYTPGGNRSYGGFNTDYHAWIDIQAEVAGPQYLPQLRNTIGFNAYPVNNEKGDRTQTPSILYLPAQAGAWFDAKDDNWIGNLNETGRVTSPDDPYNSGNEEDPNDYTDTPANHGVDPAKTGWKPEWKPGTTATTVSATVRPVCQPSEENQDGECPWGSTSPPAGVYLIKDKDATQFAPYDDAVEDAIGMPCGTPSAGQVNCDEDGKRLSRHVQYGPIQLTFQHAAPPPGEFSMNENIVLPEGSMNYDIRIEATANLEETITQRDGSNLPTYTVSDTDVLEQSQLTSS